MRYAEGSRGGGRYRGWMRHAGVGRGRQGKGSRGSGVAQGTLRT